MSINYFIVNVYFFTFLKGKLMKNRSYYSFPDMSVNVYNKCSVESASAPIIVNCAGDMLMTYPFTTDNKEGRLDYYLMYIKSGRLRVFAPEGELCATAGDAVCFPPRHRYTYSFSGEGELNYFWCHFTGSDAAALVSELGFGEPPSVCHVGHEALINAEFERVFSLFSERDDLRERILGHAFEGLLLSIAKSVRKRDDTPPLGASIEYVNENYTKDIPIPKLAKLENLSNSRFSVLFAKQTGTSPIRYITRLRMQNACELLLSTDLSVKEIGATVGYADPHFFSKHFKAYIGSSPAEYRKSFRVGE